MSMIEFWSRDKPWPSTCTCDRYWLRHGILIWVELPVYALRKRRLCAACRCLAAELSCCAAMAALWRLNSVATTWVFLIPFVVTSFALMFGNWCGGN